MAGPNKATKRKKFQSAIAHKRAANDFLDKLSAAQTTLNACLTKVDGNAPGALDVDYASTLDITAMYSPDQPLLPAQNKSTLRAIMLKGVHHRTLANELCDSLEEIQTALNALFAKLDAQAGTLVDTDFASTLSVVVLNPEADTMPAQNKASARKILRSALADASLADAIIDAVSDMQASFNDALAQLDTGTITGEMAQYEVAVLNPDV